MSACGNYVENVWRKGKCANCFRSKNEHASQVQGKVKDGEFQKENSTGFKKAANGINGHSRDEQKRTKESSGNRADNSSKTKPTDGTKGLKAGLKDSTRQQHSADAKTGNSRRENRTDLEIAHSEESKEISCPLGKPKPVPRPRARGFSRDSSSSQEDILNFRPSSAASDCSRSCSTPDDLEVQEQFCTSLEIEDPKLDSEIRECTNKIDAHGSLNELNSKSQRSQADESIGDLETIANVNNINSCANNVRNSPGETKKGTTTGKGKLKGLTAANMEKNREGDDVYMPMKNNVCEVNSEDNEKESSGNGKRPVCDKILSQSLSGSLDDRDVEELSAKEAVTIAESIGTQQGKRNGSVGGSEALKGGETIGILDMSCEPASYTTMDDAITEPYYENQLSVEEEIKRSTSTSSSTVSVSNDSTNVTSNGCGEAVNDSLSAERQVSVDETSVFHDVVQETSGNSTASSSSESSWESSTSDSSSVLENKVVLKRTSMVEIGKLSQPVKRFDPELAKKRQSNPDIKAKIEGPLYINAEAKPVTKPYKVVDISSGWHFREEECGHSDTPPLPPKERELKEIGTFDHYYCEPPEDIVPDYKKLTPLQSKEPAPELDIKRSPGGLTSLPVPRPRSQLHVSTLPRPIARAKAASGLCGGDQVIRPASQVVTRTTRLDAPKPPSTSTIPTRKPSTGVSSPPTSPTDSRPPTPGSPEGHKHEGADAAKENKDQGLKPKRVAPPPPPMGNQPASPKPKPVCDANQELTSTLRSKSSKPKPPVSETTDEAPITSTSSTKTQVQMRSPPLGTSSQPSSRSSPKSGLKRALWKRLSGRRKGKRKLDISSPILVNEEIPSFAAQQDTLRKRTSIDPSQPVCTSIRELNGGERLQVEEKRDEGASTAESSTDEKDTPKGASPNMPMRRRGHSYQNFPFSKSGSVDKPPKPNRPGRASKPVQEVKALTEINAAPLAHLQEDPAYLEPCVDQMTKKVETALANLNDAQILAEALTRVEQEKLGPLPEVPKSRHVHFKFNATLGNVSDKTVSKEGKPPPPKRPVRAVCPTLVNGLPDKDDGSAVTKIPCPPRYPARPPNTKIHEAASRGRSKSLGALHAASDPSRSHLHPSEPPRGRSLSIQNNQVQNRYTKILEMHIETLQEVVAASRAALLPGDSVDLSSTRWGDYDVCGDPLAIRAPGAVLLPVKCRNVEGELPLLARVKYPKAVIEDMSERTAFMQDMSITVSLPAHVNIARTLTHFTDTLPSQVFGLQGDTVWETLVTITDQLPVESLAEFVERTKQEHEDLPDEYERKVCILLIQLFSALDHLHGEGIVHRVINLENVLLLNHGRLVVANFGQVLQHPKDTLPTRFVYNTDGLSRISADDARAPPEVVDMSSESGTSDFEKYDVFSAGCLIYELLHEENPFKTDEALVKSDYSIDQLPQFPERSRFSCGLGALASGLLERNPAERLLPREALQLLQAFLWGPDELDANCLELSATDWLETERACSVVMIARSQSQSSSPGSEEFMDNFLKYQYLVEVTVEEVVNGYKSFAPLDSLDATL